MRKLLKYSQFLQFLVNIFFYKSVLAFYAEFSMILCFIYNSKYIVSLNCGCNHAVKSGVSLLILVLFLIVVTERIRNRFEGTVVSNIVQVFVLQPESLQCVMQSNKANAMKISMSRKLPEEVPNATPNNLKAGSNCNYCHFTKGTPIHFKHQLHP